MFSASRTILSAFCIASLFSASASADTRKSFNPDIGANFLGLIQRGTGTSNDRTQVPHNGITLQEAEVQLSADVDPYFKANALFSVEQESGSRDYGLSPEEVYVESISLPFVTVRAGKFKLALGKHNQLHTHAYPFIDAPLIHQQLLGDEGLNEPAVSAAVLLPTNWYSEIVLQAFNPANEVLYNSSNSGAVGGLARFKNLWDLSESLTMELGGSGTAGKNQFNKTSSALGGDLTFKWRPSIGGKYHSLVWSSEYLEARPTATGGIASWLQFQFAERWWAQARYEFVGLPRNDSNSTQTKQSALLGFFPSEFSGLRLQYDRQLNFSKGKDDHAIAFQYNISIGAHPAHAY